MTEKQKGLSGAALKNIALLSMVIDHFAALIYAPFVISKGLQVGSSTPYMIMRLIGRLAFPIYCFLIAQGAKHTKNRRKYALRLLIFAFVSIVPFSLACYGKVITLEGQNVFFTLLAGLVSIYLYDCFKIKNNSGKAGLAGFYAVVTALGIALVIFNTDYCFLGIILILFFYNCDDKGKLTSKGVPLFLISCALLFICLTIRDNVIAGVPMSLIDTVITGIANSSLEMCAIWSFLIINKYNGEKGKQLPKSVYYWFYPVHLLLFWYIGSKL